MKGFASETGQIRQLCSVTLHEYKGEDEFHFGNDYYGLYPTWDVSNNLVGYRPTNEKCLMRNMTSAHFCGVCKESMWLHFLNRMSLIDEVAVSECEEKSQISVKLQV